jgi:hypothetical protein
MIKNVHICITKYEKSKKVKTENWYSHIPESVNERESITTLWDQEVQTDRDVLPDIILKKKRTESA